MIEAKNSKLAILALEFLMSRTFSVRAARKSFQNISRILSIIFRALSLTSFRLSVRFVRILACRSSNIFKGIILSRLECSNLWILQKSKYNALWHFIWTLKCESDKSGVIISQIPVDATWEFLTSASLVDLSSYSESVKFK